MEKQEVLNRLHKKLIVSCQALEGEPLYRKEGHVMELMAKAAIEAGASGIRAQGVTDIEQIQVITDVPIIGIIKKVYEGYDGFITMTMTEIDALVKTGCEIIALDVTDRQRGDGLTCVEFIKQIKERYPQVLLMGDCSTLQEGLAAQEAGIDFVGTTLSGYTDYSPKIEGPDFQLIKDLVEQCTVPVIAEGRIHTPEQARHALELGAHSVVVGGAITRPLEITKRFLNAIEGE